MTRLRVTQTRSVIGRDDRQRRTLRALGLNRPHHTVEHDDTPAIRGMLDAVAHLVEWEPVGDGTPQTDETE